MAAKSEADAEIERLQSIIDAFMRHRCDDRPWGGADPPMVAYVYAADRKGERAEAHFGDFAGILQVDGYEPSVAWFDRRGRLYALHRAVLQIALAHGPFEEAAKHREHVPPIGRLLVGFDGIDSLADQQQQSSGLCAGGCRRPRRTMAANRERRVFDSRPPIRYCNTSETEPEDVVLKPKPFRSSSHRMPSTSLDWSESSVRIVVFPVAIAIPQVPQMQSPWRIPLRVIS